MRVVLGTGDAAAPVGEPLMSGTRSLSRMPKLAAATCMLGVAMLASAPVAAQHRHGHGGHGGARIGIHIGAPLFFPFPAVPFHSPPVYYYAPPPVVRVIPAPPIVYIERDDLQPPVAQSWIPPENPPQPAQPAPLPPVADWFFCADTKTYYPYVRECASPWQRVPSVPASVSPSVPR